MANKIDTEPCDGGCRITRLVTTDRDISIPGEVGGVGVVAIGPFFMSGSPASDGRTVSIPGCVRSIDPDAFGGIIGIVVGLLISLLVALAIDVGFAISRSSTATSPPATATSSGS